MRLLLRGIILVQKVRGFEARAGGEETKNELKHQQR